MDFENEFDFESEDNQTEDFDMNDDDLGFDDDESIEPDNDESQQEPNEEDDWALDVKYNGEEQKLSREDAQRFAQMGMNYEKVQSQYQELQNDPRLQFVDNLAKENGYDNVQEFLTEFQEIQEQNQLRELIENNIPEEYAREMLENRKFRQEMQQQRQAQQQEESERQQYSDLLNTFKEYNERAYDPQKDTIPQEVFDRANKEGVSLKSAYESFMNQQLRQQLKVYQQNERNFKSNPGGATSNHGNGKSGKSDPYLEGFDSYFN